FQVFSLAGFRRVSDDGVEFQSHLDGARRFLTPERAIEIQWTLGADVAMAFDHVVPGVADETTARDALERTLRWLERCGKRHRELADSRLGGQAVSTNRLTAYPTIRQTLWPILQGGTHLDLRTEGLRRILELGVWSGLAVGGLSVGEPKPAMYEMLAALEPRLPPALPRYLMGVGFPVDLVAAVERGMDLFDCVAPTRNGRNGTAFTPDGPVNIRNAAYRADALRGHAASPRPPPRQLLPDHGQHTDRPADPRAHQRPHRRRHRHDHDAAGRHCHRASRRARPSAHGRAAARRRARLPGRDRLDP